MDRSPKFKSTFFFITMKFIKKYIFYFLLMLISGHNRYFLRKLQREKKKRGSSVLKSLSINSLSRSRDQEMALLTVICYFINCFGSYIYP